MVVIIILILNYRSIELEKLKSRIQNMASLNTERRAIHKAKEIEERKQVIYLLLIFNVSFNNIF